MKIFFVSFVIIFSLSNVSVYCQKLGLGLGFEINQTRFRQYSPDVTVPFENPHNADISLGAYFMGFYPLSKKLILNIKPGLTILKTKSEVTSDITMNYFILGSEIGYFINKSNRLNIGLEYSYLIEMLTSFHSPPSDFTFFANNRQSINPTISFEHQWDKNWTTHLKFTYFTKDLFNSGALDAAGNIVGPVKVTPYTFALGFNFYASPKPHKVKKAFAKV